MPAKRSALSRSVTDRESFPTSAQGSSFVDQSREYSNLREMGPAVDIVLLLALDGKEWGKYISDRLHTFPQVTHASIILNSQDQQDSSAVTWACQRSAAVVVLLATCQLLDFMQKKAAWFAPLLRELSTTSSLVVLLLLDRQDVDDVTHKYGYVTGDWKFKDAGHTCNEVQERLAEVLDMVDVSRQAKHGRVQSMSSNRVSKTPVEFFPSVVYERDTRVAMVFKEEVHGEVTLKLQRGDTPLTAWRETDTVFTFSAPQKPSGKYNVLVFVDNKRLRGRSELTYRGLDMASLTSRQYLQQALRLDTVQDLDVYLKDLFNNSLPADHALETLFRHLPDLDMAEQQKNASTLYPTLLHFAAAFGLSEFCAALLECPGSTRAFRIRNCEELDPAELAALNGFDELENYIIDFMEMQTAADKEYSDYMDMSQLSGQQQVPESLYDRATELYRPVRKHSEGSCQTQSQIELSKLCRTYRKHSLGSSQTQSHIPPALPPRPETSTPLLASSSQDGAVDFETYTQLVTPSSDCGAVDSNLSVELSSAARLDRPAVPPPRFAKRAGTIAGLEGPSPLLTQGEEKRKAHTLPVGATLDACRAFMGMDSDTAAKPELPSGALGSRSQTELIEVNEMVKTNEINVKQAQMLFRAWQQRHGKTNNASFKDRQRELRKLKSEYKQQAEAQEKQDQRTEQKKFLSRLRIGGRQEKHSSIKLDISNPIISTSAKKSTRVYSRVSFTEHVPATNADRDSTTSTASSSESSCDSGCSQQSRHSNVSASSEPEGESEGDEVFNPGGIAVQTRDRLQTESSSTNRLSLGHMYLQQAHSKSGSNAMAPPPLPPLPTTLQTRISNSWSTTTESSDFEGTTL